MSAPVVAADNDASVRLAVSHLREHGHKKIALLATPEDTVPVGRRHQAWRDAAGGGPLLRCACSRSAASGVTLRLAATHDVRQALVTATDEPAIGVLAGAYAAGLAVPGRLAVIRLDGTRPARAPPRRAPSRNSPWQTWRDRQFADSSTTARRRHPPARVDGDPAELRLQRFRDQPSVRGWPSEPLNPLPGPAGRNGSRRR